MKGLAAVAAGIGVALIARRLLSSSHGPGSSRWFRLTIECEPEELTGPDRPAALVRLAGKHLIRVSPAPGGRGAEVAMRAAGGKSTEQLRQLKRIIEAREDAVVEGQSTGHRTR
ncbi:hypothetical protein [Herbidospora cretacea]|uniref:hypothetical protein n=1 Tax=Herbidospora cretacea TaxID=28444 RepID=UPI0012DD01CB|nr:hypothetical protein [Herbidospora cretacea]